MKKMSLLIACLLFITTSCSLMEEENWTGNSLVEINWMNGNLETGRRPFGLDSCFINFYPQSGSVTSYKYYMPTDENKFDVPTGYYDILALHASKYIKRREMYRTATVEIPTFYNENHEKQMMEIPDTMIYAGFANDVKLDFSEKRNVDINVKRLFKKIHFVAIIGDTKELYEDCLVDISGMANRMKIWNNELDKDDEAVINFPLKKRGRHLNTTKCLTSFQGCIYVLGVTGRNILHFYYTNAENERIKLKINISSYFNNFTSDEITVHLRINVDTNDNILEIAGWDEGNTTDVDFIH